MPISKVRSTIMANPNGTSSTSLPVATNGKLKIIFWAKSTLGDEVDLVALFEHPTIQTLASAIRESGRP
jgi:hypothetical protein